MNLRLERKNQPDETGDVAGLISFTPPIDADYWEYRVIVGERQAVVGFPKFSTIGIGFAFEEDWNTNLPWASTTESIWKHISHNKGDESIPDAWCIQAIEMIQSAVAEDHPEMLPQLERCRS